MKLIEALDFLPYGTWVRIWGKDENTPVFEGKLRNTPMYLANRELVKGDDGVYFELRYETCGYTFKDGVKEHVAIFIDED